MSPVGAYLGRFLGWMLSIGIVAGGIGVHSSEQHPIRTYKLSRFYGAAVKKSVSRVPLLSESIFVGYFPMHVNGSFRFSENSTGRKGFFKRDDTGLFNARRY